MSAKLWDRRFGNVAYETIPDAPMVVDEGVIVEIVTPGTGDPLQRRRNWRSASNIFKLRLSTH